MIRVNRCQRNIDDDKEDEREHYEGMLKAERGKDVSQFIGRLNTELQFVKKIKYLAKTNANLMA